MTGCDIVSFDLDGTLVDSAAEIVAAANAALREHRLDERPEPEIAGLIGYGARELMLGLLARAFLERPSLADRVRVDDVLASFDAHYARAIGGASRTYAGARQALVDLRRMGVRTACVSNKELRHATRVLQVHGLDAQLDLVIGGDSLPYKKPHAGVLRHVAAALRGDLQRMAHVGDSAIDVQAAQAAGVAAWAVSYGYHGSVPIEQAMPHRLFDSLGAVVEHVRGLRPSVDERLASGVA